MFAFWEPHQLNSVIHLKVISDEMNDRMRQFVVCCI